MNSGGMGMDVSDQSMSISASDDLAGASSTVGGGGAGHTGVPDWMVIAIY